MERVVRTFRVSLEKWQRLEKLAEELGCSRGQLLRGAINLLLESKDLANLVKGCEKW